MFKEGAVESAITGEEVSPRKDHPLPEKEENIIVSEYVSLKESLRRVDHVPEVKDDFSRGPRYKGDSIPS